MATTFLDGPAEGVRLGLERAPPLIRVVNKGTKWDALDQLSDLPEPNETIYLYRLMDHAGGMFIDYRDSSGRRRGHFEVNAAYTYYSNQPADSILREKARYQTWYIREVQKLEAQASVDI